MKKEIERILEEKRILPFLTVRDLQDVSEIGGVLKEAGIPIVEIALRSELAIDAMKEMKKIDGVYVGAGTVKTREEAEAVLEAGADFIVSPGSSDEIMEFCAGQGVPVYPGVVTPSEVMDGYSRGIRSFKFFPAETYGGIHTLKALKGPFPDVRFLPTGGIGIQNYKEYLALDNVCAVGGNFILPEHFIREKDWNGLLSHVRGLI